jgi:nucleoside-diphosphate kinase
MKEISYVMVKPGFANFQAIIDEVKQRLGEAGFEITDEAFVNYTEDDVKKHYAEHIGRNDYEELKAFIVSDKCYGMKVEGENAISAIRTIVGPAKNPAPGTIRHDIPEALGLSKLSRVQNVVHAADSVNAAKLEIEIFYDILRRNSKERD